MTAGMRARHRKQMRCRQGGDDKGARLAAAVEQTGSAVAVDLRKQQRFCQMREIFVEPEKLIAPAHALAGRIDENEDRRVTTRLDDIEHAARQGQRVIDAEGLAAIDAEHVHVAAAGKFCCSADQPLFDGHLMPFREEGHQHLIERHLPPAFRLPRAAGNRPYRGPARAPDH